jgi:hypothetical protein
MTSLSLLHGLSSSSKNIQQATLRRSDCHPCLNKFNNYLVEFLSLRRFDKEAATHPGTLPSVGRKQHLKKSWGRANQQSSKATS